MLCAECLWATTGSEHVNLDSAPILPRICACMCQASRLRAPDKSPLTLHGCLTFAVVLAFSSPVILIDEVLKCFGRAFARKELAARLRDEAKKDK